MTKVCIINPVVTKLMSLPGLFLIFITITLIRVGIFSIIIK